MLRTLLKSAAVMACLAAPLHAQGSGDGPVRAEILPGWTLKDGRRMAGLRLTLEPGWKTYWRVPGDAGIPPQFSWKGARNVRSVAINWPTPKVYYDYGMRSLGYDGTVILPLVIDAKDQGGDIRLKGKMRMGLCADVCVPYELGIDSELAPPADRPTPAIAAALTEMPYTAQEAKVSAATCRITPNAGGMSIEARVTLPSTGSKEVSVIEPGLDHIWTSEPRTTRSGNTITAVADMVHIEEKPFSVDRSRVRITIIGSNYAVDIQGCTGS